MSFREEIEALLADYVAAFEARDSGGCAGIYTDDAVVFSPWGPPVQGRAEIEAVHRDWFGLGEKNKRIDVFDCAHSGDLGYVLIRYRADVTGDDGGSREEAGTNLATVVREDEGWRLRYSSMNEEASG